MALEKIKPRVVDATGNYTFNNVTLTGSLLSSSANISNIVGITNIVANTNTITVTGNLTTDGNVSAGNIKTNNLLYANGTAWSFGGSGSTPPGGSTTQVQFNDSGTFGGSSSFTFNKTTNTLSVDNISSNGAQLSSLNASNITGQVSNALLAGTVYTNAQPNITSIGTLTSLSVTGNIISGNANLGNATTSNYFIGNGTLLSSITGANVTGQVGYAAVANSVSGSNVVGQVTYAATANAVSGANVMGAVSQATYADTANSVAGANVSGNVTSAVQSHYANIANSVAGSNVSGAVSSATNAGTVTTAAQPNITSVGTLTGLTVTGNIASGNANLGNAVVANYFVGNGAYLTGVDLLSVGNADVANSIANGTSNINTPVANGNITVSIGGVANTVVFTSTGMNVTGNITTAGSGGNLSGANYVVANYFVGNGSQLTGVDLLTVGNANIANRIANGTSNVDTPLANGNVTVSIGGTSNTVVFTSTGVNVAGTLNVGGNTIVGNLTVIGTTTTVNSTTTRVVDPIFELGGGANGAALSSDDNKDRGLLLHYYSGASTVDAFMGWDDSNVEFAFGSNVSVTNEVTTFNNFGNVRASYFLGNGSQLTGISAVSSGYIVNGTSNVNIPTLNGNVTVGVAGTNNVLVVTSTGANVTGTMTATGNVSGSFILGNGFYLSGVDAAGRVVNGTSNIAIATSGGNVTTSVGGTANVMIVTSTGANVTGTMTATGNVSGSFVLGNGFYLSGVDAAGRVVNGTSNIAIATANGNVTTSVGGTSNVVIVTSTGMNVAGYVNTGVANVTANYFIGNGAFLTGVDTSNTANKLANGTSNVNIPLTNGNVTFGVGGAGNIVIVTSTGIVVTGSGTISAAGGTVSAGAITGPLTTAAQPNITSLGTLTGLTVSGNASIGNITSGGSIYANSGIVKGQYLYGDGSNLTGLGGAGYIFNGSSNVFIATAGGNVNFTVGATANIVTVTSTGVNVAGYINAGSGALTTTGNVAAGNASLGNLVTANYFSGTLYGTSNSAGTVTTGAQPNITSVGTLANLTVNGLVDLGTASNIKIGGGSSGSFLKTDGSGNLSWAVPSGGGGGGTSLTYTSATTPPASGNILGDQWFNTSANILYEYISDGTASYWVDISGATTTTTTPTTLNLSNVTITGGTAGQFIITDGAGNLSFATVSTSSISNGNSNISITANGNIRLSAIGTSNVLVISNVGITVTGITDLGSASNLRISGGSNNQVLTSNGAGGATWQEPQNVIHPFLLMGA